jgi:hypothetical protein
MKIVQKFCPMPLLLLAACGNDPPCGEAGVSSRRLRMRRWLSCRCGLAISRNGLTGDCQRTCFDFEAGGLSTRLRASIARQCAIWRCQKSDGKTIRSGRHDAHAIGIAMPRRCRSPRSLRDQALTPAVRSNFCATRDRPRWGRRTTVLRDARHM